MSCTSKTVGIVALAVATTVSAFHCIAEGAGPRRPARPYKGVGFAETLVQPHPTLPEPILLFQATEVGNYTHWGKSTVVTMKGDFNPVTGVLENGVAVATTADKSTATAEWNGKPGPDGRFIGTVRWIIGTKRLVHVSGESMFISTPLSETSFRNDHSGMISY